MTETHHAAGKPVKASLFQVIRPGNKPRRHDPVAIAATVPSIIAERRDRRPDQALRGSH
jgi:hypothetical protein